MRVVCSVILFVVLVSIWMLPRRGQATNESSYKFGYNMGFGIYQLGVTEHGEDGPPGSNDIDRCVIITCGGSYQLYSMCRWIY